MKTFIVAAGLIVSLSLASTANAAGGVVCKDPRAVEAVIVELAPIIARPDQPSDQEDMAAIYNKYHCVAVANIPDALIGMLLRQGDKQSVPAPVVKEHESAPVKDTI